MIQTDALLTYLNDHLAGSVSAIEILEKIVDREKHRPLGDTCTQLHGEITKDQGVVQQLIARLGGSESSAKKAAAWVAEKVGRLKLSSDEASKGVTLVEELETLALGIQGKLALWVGLEQLARRTGEAQLMALDYPTLQSRAKSQYEMVEQMRQEAVFAAFA